MDRSDQPRAGYTHWAGRGGFCWCFERIGRGTMMSFLEIYGAGLVVILVIMILLWLLSLRLKNSSIVDIFWGTGFVLAGWVYFALTPDGAPARKLLLAALVTIWGLRLSIYILVRNWGKPEDFRYQKFRRDAGEKWW